MFILRLDKETVFYRREEVARVIRNLIGKRMLLFGKEDEMTLEQYKDYAEGDYAWYVDSKAEVLTTLIIINVARIQKRFVDCSRVYQ